MKGFNIQAKDLNFNSVLIAFQIRDLNKESQNLSELMTILKEEGLEIL
jgi:ubiquinone/menaquinone biosynthesis C-methylase UbiE